MKRWTKEEDSLLATMLEEGYDMKHIVAKNMLPGRTYDAIRKRWRKLELPETRWSTEEDKIILGLDFDRPFIDGYNKRFNTKRTEAAIRLRREQLDG